MQLLSVDSTHYEFLICTSIEAQINHFFQKMMYYSCLVLVVLLSHHSLGLVDYFSSSSSSSSSSLFKLFVRPICVAYLFLLVAYNFFLPDRYNR